MSSIADRIDQGVIAAGISQAELARRAKMPTPQYVSRIKSGELKGREYLAAIASTLNCSVNWLSSGRGEAPRWWHEEISESAPVPMAPLPPLPETEVWKQIYDLQRQISTMQAALRESDAQNHRLEERLRELEERRSSDADRRHGRRKTTGAS